LKEVYSIKWFDSVFGDYKMTEDNNTNNVPSTDGNEPVLEEITKTSLYIVGEGVFRDEKHLEEVRTTHGQEPKNPPLEDMGYTQEILDYLNKPKDTSDRHLWP
jgi:hypothetical protein